ncbi:MAG: HupE/UreJ family protein [Nitrospirota bacterium]|nr:HupE/UreJ family protein [Nitrospirota bacterium]
MAWCLPAAAHEVRPAYLQLNEIQPGQFSVLWKVPARGDRVLSLQAVLPSNCQTVTSPTPMLLAGTQLTRWKVDCGATGLDGATIRIQGLSATMIDTLVRIELLNGVVVSQILRPELPTIVVNARGGVALTGYVHLGIEHILLGIDHLLFVLGLLLIVRGKWQLVKTITAFTVAHSITLALATLDVMQVPQAPVEAVIALSIVFLATELARSKGESLDLIFRFPWIVAFVFGLLHGFGFAGALSEVGLPQTDIPLALLLFNGGVEVGQLLFVGVFFALGWLIHRAVETLPTWLTPATAYGIGSVSSYWLIERIVAMIRPV